jgi:tight adherence protein B
MGVIVLIVFVAVFAVVALLAAATGTGASKQDKEMLARLDSALSTDKSKSDMSDLLIDVRKNELLSTIPWIDKALRKVELTPRLRRLLYQADLKWTVGGLMMMCFVALEC